MDIIVAASKDAIMMVEGEMHELQEDVVIDALLFAHQAVQPLIELQERLRAAERQGEAPVHAAGRRRGARRARQGVSPGTASRRRCRSRTRRSAATRSSTLHPEIRDRADRRGPAVARQGARTSTRRSASSRRSGRAVTRCRRASASTAATPTRSAQITIETGVLPRAHGSALFTRGETQALVAVTLGTKYDEKKLDTLLGDTKKTFYMDYNFPPFSTGEVKPLRGQSRREVGHGFLAERSVEAIVPIYEDFPYTIRVVSDILESNGSSSMASVCGGSLALMDAGVPTKAPVAGIAMGLMKEGDDYVILSDILGDEDHLGDMDFKVTGTRRGVCALQMDIKVDGLTRKILEEALEQAKRGRVHILDKMDAAICGAARRGLDLRAAHRHGAGQAGQGPRHHRPRWQDDPRDPGADRRADRHQRQRHGVDRVGRCARPSSRRRR